MSQNLTEKLKSILGKPVLVGVAAAAGAYALGQTSDVSVFGKSIPAWVYVGGVATAGTFAAQSLSQFVIPYLPGSAQTKTIEAGLVSPAITAATAFLAVKYLDASTLTIDPVMAAVLGAGAYVAGDYGYNHFLNSTSVIM